MEDEQILIKEIHDIFKAALKPCYDNTSKTEIYCRCPNCGDSKKDKSAAHFYIQMRAPFKFFCQKCGFSGNLNQEIVDKLGIYNNNLLLMLNTLNKNIKINNNVVYSKKDFNFEYADDTNERSEAALKYFNERFGVEETIESVNEKFKCICDPIGFMQANSIQPNSRFDFSKSIGFLCSDNKYMVCRDISGTQSLRYMNLSLSEDVDKSKIYNIKRPIDILSDKVTLIITEGIFDCIGVYYKFYENNEDQNLIISAACGKSSYSQVVEKFIKMGFLNLNVEIYSDTDVPISTFTNLKRNLVYLKNKQLTVYYNTLNKDCGCEKDKILVTKTII